ncbi:MULTISPECIES: phage GP46 family protein [unclassified Psychrobacter]|uniref:phage GP46 family protein n=1 Tax=unclassified Psychrobacter TaxID=196806 RepID=UPI0018F2E3EA|nr:MULTISPECIES: phage GP46 family protein [unclassified Psychrobacter]
MRFDQVNNDYTLDSISAPRSAGKQALAEAAYLRMMTPKGSYFADPALGSELYKLKRSKDVPRMRRQALAWAKAALEPLRAPYYLTSIDVTADNSTSGHLSIKAVLTQADGSQATTSINVQVAG